MNIVPPRATYRYHSSETVSPRSRRGASMSSPSLTALLLRRGGAGDDLRGDLFELAVLALRGPAHHVERRVGSAVLVGHEDALGPLDHGPRLHGDVEVAALFERRPVGGDVGDGDRGLLGEGQAAAF